MRRIFARLVIIGSVLLVAACSHTTPAAEAGAPVPRAHAWKVYDRDLLILEVSDVPGPILSTAALPPGATPARHPFLSASARSAKHEDALRKHLVAAKSLPQFLDSLVASNYRVVPAADVAVPTAPPIPFEVARNIEISPYCVPYPSAYLQEDTSERWEHGRRVFTSARTHARMDIAALCPSRPLADLLADDRKNITAPLTTDDVRSDAYVLAWREGTRLHWGRMAAQHDDPGCFVLVRLEYDEADRPTFDAVIARLATTDTTCPP